MLELKDKTQAVVEWAKRWDGFDGYLKLNAIVTESGDSTLVTETVDRVLQPYIDGTAIRQYAFTLRLVLPWSSGFDQTNDDSMEYAVKLFDWVVEQNHSGVYPDWPGARIMELLPTQSLPSMNFVYENDGLAEYLIRFIIDYEE